jgi:hypothetical protein
MGLSKVRTRMTGTQSDPTSHALLVLLSAEHDANDPTRWTGTVYVGGHTAKVTLGFGRFVPDLIQHVDVPTVMSIHRPSLAAVVSAISRIVAGEQVPLPLDLSGEVASVDPPFPFRPLQDAKRAKLDAAADTVALQIVRVERETSDPWTVRADLVLDGRRITVRAQLFTAPDAVPVTAWLTGPAQGELTDAQRYAIQRVLLSTST